MNSTSVTVSPTPGNILDDFEEAYQVWQHCYIAHCYIISLYLYNGAKILILIRILRFYLV